MEDLSNLYNEQTGRPGLESLPDLGAWTYRLQMQLAPTKVYYELRQWHPMYGTLRSDDFALAREVGHTTASYIVSALWVGATELMERTVD